ncbi:hypothetical protein [Emticicia oligotrophica]|uniref:hypothetical protein n=1 Tax=Emticicia oligotrophica TaxID=312279 RepID=UPI00273CD5E2|nr:hypothetical protein [Emticicia oligotrophica]
MPKVFTKGEVDRLGHKIRQFSISMDDETLIELQNYRTSHKDALSQTFTILCELTKKIHPRLIVTFRIKRFESIIGKLERYPEMRFSRMWDIAGCRCIVRNDNDVYKLKRLIEDNQALEIVKEYDYIKNPQEDGYKSLHLFVKHVSNDKIVEVQLRNQVNHNWATLVEITDFLFDSRLKEYGENKELLRFHKLLSKIENLTVEDKYEIAKIITKYNYFEKLSEVFSRNYLSVRRQWFELESQTNHKYFLIETRKDDIPKIESFANFQFAENKYFNVYKTSQNANIVLTHLQTPNYNQISIAYSNYILTFHSFLTECLDILESLIVESLANCKYLAFYKNYNLYNGLVLNHIKNMVAEVQEIYEYTEQSKEKRKQNKRKEKEWIDDIKKQINQHNFRSKRLQVSVKKNMPTTFFGNFFINQMINIINSNYKRKAQNTFPK